MWCWLGFTFSLRWWIGMISFLLCPGHVFLLTLLVTFSCLFTRLVKYLNNSSIPFSFPTFNLSSIHVMEQPSMTRRWKLISCFCPATCSISFQSSIIRLHFSLLLGCSFYKPRNQSPWTSWHCSLSNLCPHHPASVQSLGRPVDFLTQ